MEMVLVEMLCYRRQGIALMSILCMYIGMVLFIHTSPIWTTLVCTRVFEIYFACYIKPKLLTKSPKYSLRIGIMSQCISNDNETPPMQSSIQ